MRVVRPSRWGGTSVPLGRLAVVASLAFGLGGASLACGGGARRVPPQEVPIERSSSPAPLISGASDEGEEEDADAEHPPPPTPIPPAPTRVEPPVELDASHMELDGGVATQCSPKSAAPLDVDVRPEAPRAVKENGRETLETLSFVVANRLALPRNVEVVEIDRLAAPAAGAKTWSTAVPLTVKHAYFEGGSFGPPGTRLFLPANATSTVTVELEPSTLTAPKRGVRVHLKVDDRPICYERRID